MTVELFNYYNIRKLDASVSFYASVILALICLHLGTMIATYLFGGLALVNAWHWWMIDKDQRKAGAMLQTLVEEHLKEKKDED